MGAFVEINDTLQITKAQGFPAELDFEKHRQNPIKLDDLADKVFEFHNKPDIRIYKTYPIRNFLVENINGKWLYWGLVHITEITHDYVNKTTSGKFKIIKINTLEEMRMAFDLIDTRPEMNYLSN